MVKKECFGYDESPYNPGKYVIEIKHENLPLKEVIIFSARD